MKFYTEQAGLWLKPNTASQLKPDMPQADVSNQHVLSAIEILIRLQTDRRTDRQTN